MTRDKLEKMTFEEILRYIKGLEHQNLRYKYNMRARRERLRKIELAAQTQVAKGNIIALYYRDEITGLHYRAERPAQWVLNNNPTDNGVA